MAATLTDPVSGKPVTLYGADGRPLDMSRRHADDGHALGHVLTFASIFGSASNVYFHMWDNAMRESRANALAMRHDTFLMALLEERKDATSSLKWHLEPDDPRDPTQAAVADACEKILKATPDFISLQHYLLEALWYGRHGAMLKWRFAEMALPQPTVASSAVPGSGAQGTAVQRCLVVESHFPVQGDKIGHFHDHTPYLKIHSSERDRVQGIPEIAVTTEGFGLALTGEWRERCLIHYHGRNDADFFDAQMAESVHGVGIRHYISFYEFLRKDFITAVLDALERVGLGLVVVKFDASNPRAKAEAEDLARNMSRRSVVTVPVTKDGRESGGGVEIVEGPTAGMQILLSLREYCDKQIERFVVGQSISAGTTGVGLGGAGIAAFAAKTQHRRFSGDAHRLAETLAGSKMRPGLVSIIKQHTFPWADFPVKFSYEVEDPESERKLGAAAMIANMDIPVVADEVRAFAGLSKPDAEDDVVSASIIQQRLAGAMPQGATPPAEQGGGGGGDELAALLGDVEAGGGGGGGGQSLQMRRGLGDDTERLRWLYGQALARGDRAAAAKYAGQLEVVRRAQPVRYAAEQGGLPSVGGVQKPAGNPAPLAQPKLPGVVPAAGRLPQPVGRVENPIQPQRPNAQTPRQQQPQQLHEWNEQAHNALFDWGDTMDMLGGDPSNPSPLENVLAHVKQFQIRDPKAVQHLTGALGHFDNYIGQKNYAGAKSVVGGLDMALSHSFGVPAAIRKPFIDELQGKIDDVSRMGRDGSSVRYALHPSDPPQPRQLAPQAPNPPNRVKPPTGPNRTPTGPNRSPVNPVVSPPAARVASPVAPQVRPAAAPRRPVIPEGNQRAIDVIDALADTYDLPRSRGQGQPSPADLLIDFLRAHPGVARKYADRMEGNLREIDDAWHSHDANDPASRALWHGHANNQILDLADGLRQYLGADESLAQAVGGHLLAANDRAFGYARQGQPLRLARAGLGSFTNPGAFAPGGRGTDYPSTFEQQGPVKPPQPWQLQGRRTPGTPQVSAGPAAAQQQPQQQLPRPQQPAPVPPAALSHPGEDDQDFQDRPEHDPTQPPDAYSQERQPPQLKGAGLTDEEVEELRKTLGDEGFQKMLEALAAAEGGGEDGPARYAMDDPLGGEQPSLNPPPAGGTVPPVRPRLRPFTETQRRQLQGPSTMPNPADTTYTQPEQLPEGLHLHPEDKRRLDAEDARTAKQEADDKTHAEHVRNILGRQIKPRSAEDVFLDAVRGNPADDATRLIYADWLEDHGRSRQAHALRASGPLLRAVLASRDSLRGMRVEPTTLTVGQHYWHWADFRAAPSHPRFELLADVNPDRVSWPADLPSRGEQDFTSLLAGGRDQAHQLGNILGLILGARDVAVAATSDDIVRHISFEFPAPRRHV